MKYYNLFPGEIIRTEGVKNEKLGTNDQVFAGIGREHPMPGWLDAPSCWNGEKIPKDIQFRRPIL